MFTDRYGELCKGVDCRKIKSCAECNIGKKLNLCAAYENTGLTLETCKEIAKKMDYILGHFLKDIESEALGWFDRAVWHVKKVNELARENKKLRQELEFWKLEAIKAQSELGEKLIKSVKLDDVITDMMEHFCDSLCKYPEVYNGNHAGLQECDGKELEDICGECKMGKYICDILNLYKGGIADGKDK